MNNAKILIVGAGGIGSWLCYFLHNLNNVYQLHDVSITVADGDTVEKKNLRYQKFDIFFVSLQSGFILITCSDSNHRINWS